MSLAKRIIPCLDVDKGRVVKGTQFINIRDAGDPVEAAKRYNEQGADEIVFLDITASHEDRDNIVHIVEQTARHIFIPLTVGGGIRNLDDIRRILYAGADKIAINTSAIKNPLLIKQAAERFGSQCIVVAIDAKKTANTVCKWEVYTHGGRNNTGLDAVLWAKKVNQLGAGELLITSMDRDGTKQGFDLQLMATINKEVDIPIIASGGAGKLEDLFLGVTEGQADAVLAASIFHFNKYTVKDVKDYLKKRNIIVRC